MSVRKIHSSRLPIGNFLDERLMQKGPAHGDGGGWYHFWAGGPGLWKKAGCANQWAFLHGVCFCSCLQFPALSSCHNFFNIGHWCGTRTENKPFSSLSCIWLWHFYPGNISPHQGSMNKCKSSMDLEISMPVLDFHIQIASCKLWDRILLIYILSMLMEHVPTPGWDTPFPCTIFSVT